MRVLRSHRDIAAIRTPAYWLLGLLTLQILLGFAAFVTRVVLNQDAASPMKTLVIFTVAHVAVGALVLANTVVLAIQSRRNFAVRNEQLVTNPGKALVA
jgi:heme A synthase